MGEDVRKPPVDLRAEAVRAQFGDTFKPFRDLRIRRNELEYPTYPDEEVDADEAVEAVRASAGLIEAARKVLPHLSFF